jgi:hypothetical protein
MSSLAPAANHAAALSDPSIGGDAALVPALQDGLQRLNACAAEVFLALGGALQSVAVEAREVAGLSKAAVGLGTAGESDQSMHKLQLILTDAVQVQALGQVSREKLHEVFSHLKQSRAPLGRLMNLPSVLNIVGMLYRIEASRLESASINVSSLTADMDGMGRQIGKRVATVGTQEMNLLIDPVLADSLKLSKMLAVLFEKTAKLRADLESAVAVAERAGVVIQVFDSVLEELDRNLGRMGYSPGTALSHDGKTARLSALYSMESERLVHEQLLGVGKPAPDAAGATPPAADELGSNVELF